MFCVEGPGDKESWGGDRRDECFSLSSHPSLHMTSPTEEFNHTCNQSGITDDFLYRGGEPLMQSEW